MMTEELTTDVLDGCGEGELRARLEKTKTMLSQIKNSQSPVESTLQAARDKRDELAGKRFATVLTRHMSDERKLSKLPAVEVAVAAEEVKLERVVDERRRLEETRDALEAKLGGAS